ncbi:MAG: LysR family transcriptional regulator [Bifidobacterium crudilactis]|nr:LysR family transcriptional regulator [Bifidobacterium crudilactis]
MSPVNDLSFTHLVTLIAVFENGEFTAAADELGIAQSTVSKRIATLESAFGLRLFIRRAKSQLLPTPAGKRLYSCAAEVLRQWSDTVYHMNPHNFRKTPFSLLLSHTASSTLLPKVIRGLNGLLDTMQFSAHTMNSDQIIDGIIKKQAHMGIIEKPVDTDMVRLDVLGEDKLVLAFNTSAETAASAASASQASVSHHHGNSSTSRNVFPDISSDTLWLLRESGSGVRYFTDMFFRTFDISPTHMVELDSNEKIRSVLASGVGCTVLSENCGPPNGRTFDPGEDFIRHFYAVTPNTGLNPDQHIIAEHVMELLR